MSTGAGDNLTYEFGPFRLDPAERLLLRDGFVVALTPKAFDLLVYLVERHGRLAEKQALLSALWPDAIVEEANLASNVSALRRVLDEGEEAASVIQTVPTRGYRFVAPVKTSQSMQADPARDLEAVRPGLPDGETLAAQLARGPLALTQLLRIGIDITDALEVAHGQSIVHGGLTPGNVILTSAGTRLLNFGLANTTAIESAVTYTAPEQVPGLPTDARTDIYALGAILHEMASGQQAPAALDRIIQGCLARDPVDRWQSAHDVKLQLQGLQGEVPRLEAASPPTLDRRRTMWIPWTVAAVCVALAGTTLLRSSRPLVTQAQAVARLTVLVPEDEELSLATPALALSPDGAHLVYNAKRGEVWQLHLRSIDSLETKALLGTEGAGVPFFSPDGQWIGFFAEGKLKKIPVTGGASQIVCDASDLVYGASWAPNDVIYFASGSFSGLSRVSAAGGVPQPFTTLQGGEISHRSPQVLPGGQAVLFTSRTGPGFDERQVQVQRVSGDERRLLVRGDTGYYVPTGHLVYVQTATATLEAVAFDVTHLQVGAASPVVVAEGFLPDNEGAHYTFSNNGVLAYLRGPSGDDRTLVWVDRHGNAEPLPAPGRSYEVPRISPDGTQVAFMTRGARMEVWAYNLARGNATRLVSEGSNQYPIWTQDGRRLTYRGTRAGTRNVYWRMADGSGTEDRLTTGQGNHAPGSWSPDGTVLLYMDSTTGNDISELRLSERKTQPFVRTPFSEFAPRFSPDGRWVAYISEESGRYEVYVRPYPGPGGRIQISTGGGTEPVWNPNGRELLYRSGNKMMAVETATAPVLAVGKPRMLFTGDFVQNRVGLPNYDISRDGRRFLMVQPGPQEHLTQTQIVVVLNWFDELKRLVPPAN